MQQCSASGISALRLCTFSHERCAPFSPCAAACAVGGVAQRPCEKPAAPFRNFVSAGPSQVRAGDLSARSAIPEALHPCRHDISAFMDLLTLRDYNIYICIIEL